MWVYMESETLETLKEITVFLLKTFGYQEFTSEALSELERIYREKPNVVNMVLRIIYLKLRKLYE